MGRSDPEFAEELHCGFFGLGFWGFVLKEKCLYKA